ncbi:hypothetical protein EDM56_06880 [Brevibacillus fluminis]|uniref:Uncharacterized protein n=1 Tax=Brevibacillus fluminis TaxID=511487 RepID=A0A3M8DS09_9BACL|nr:hypothetical protein [Brevibacillus fluminis]RNB90241.1 hypothetical protein EDM56_06880 [Brevibacillus fluminis]
MLTEKAREIIVEFERLSDEDKSHLSVTFMNIYGKQIFFSLDQLCELEYQDLETIKSMIGGIILTREYVPDIQNAYEGLKDNDWPSTISFGYLNLPK